MEALILLGVLAAAYFLPSIVAGMRGHHNGNAILILNLFLGWTLLGWVLSLVWAATAVQRREATSVTDLPGKGRAEPRL